MGLLGILANGFVLVVMVKHVTKKSRPSTLLIIHQTVADTMCSVNVLITYVLLLTMNGKLEGWWGDMLCWIFINESLFLYGLIVSSYGLVIVTFERYLMVVRPVYHRNHFNTRMVGALILADWLGALGILAPLSLYYDVENNWCMTLPEPRYISDQSYILAYTMYSFIIPVCLLVYGGWATTRALIKRTREIKSVNSTGQDGSLSKSQINVTVTMAMVVVVFLICFLPFEIGLVCYSFDVIMYDPRIFGPLFVICLVNCFVNPFIYVAKLQVFKTGVKKMFHIQASSHVSCTS